MRAMCLAAVALIALAGRLPAEDKVSGDDVLKKLQGTWQFLAQEMDGKAMEKDDVAKLKIIFSGDKWTVRAEGKVVQGGTHKFDPSKKPGHVDALITEGEGKGGKMLGIYELEGDRIKVCFDVQGKERPTSFKSKAGQFAAVVQREKDKP